jgi:hypothetical protein
MAWQRISPNVTAKDFIQCCMSNAVDGTDDYMLWNSSEDGGNRLKISNLAFRYIRYLWDTDFTINCAAASLMEHIYIKSIVTSGLRDTNFAKQMPSNKPHTWHSVSS